MQGNMAVASKKRASRLPYVPQNQLTLDGFESPFAQKLSPTNRWVVLAHQIPWDSIVGIYAQEMRNDETGASHINPRVVLGALIIKHMCNLSDEETVLQLQENMYMQYFIGYSGFSQEPPFSATLFVEIRKRLGVEKLNQINDRIVDLATKENSKVESSQPSCSEVTQAVDKQIDLPSHKGRLLIDATACPQGIAYPTDLNILNDARIKSEEIIDRLYRLEENGGAKPRTYREKARKEYLHTAQKKNKSSKAIRKSVGQQLRYLRRNFGHINTMLDKHERIPLSRKLHRYLLVIQEVYRQQSEMYENRVHSIKHRIVSIHQPHVRPIVRGKLNSKVEFGAKINVSLVDGYAYLDHLDWEAYNEGALLIESIEKHKKRTGQYPEEVLADKIYCTRENRRQLKERGIKLIAKPLGRPSAVNQEHVRPGERNPIEGKFGQAKIAYGLNRIRAKLQNTSESWIASIILVLNLVKLAGEAPLYLIVMIVSYIKRPGRGRVQNWSFTF